MGVFHQISFKFAYCYDLWTEKQSASSIDFNEVFLNFKTFLVKEQVLRIIFREYVLKEKLDFKKKKPEY